MVKIIENITKSALVHYFGICSILLSGGITVAIAKSNNFALGSGKNSLSLINEAKSLKNKIVTNENELHEVKEEVESITLEVED